MHASRLILYSASVALMSTATGCASITSSKDTVQEGFSYYLPKRMVKISVVRAPAQAVKDEQPAAGAARTNSPADTQSTKDAVDSGQTIVTPSYVDTITVTALAPVADVNQRYTARLHHNPLRHDTWMLKTNAAGLLSNSDVKMEDQTAAIVVAIAQTVATLTTAGLTPPPMLNALKYAEERNGPAGKKKEPIMSSRTINCGHGMSREDWYESDGTSERNITPKKAFTLDMTLDPFGPAPGSNEKGWKHSSWSYLESALCAQGADYRFEFSGTGATSEFTKKDGDGLYFRRELPYLLTVESGQRETAPTQHAAQRVGMEGAAFYSTGSAGSFQLALPNVSPPQLLPVKSGFMTTATNTSTFDNGMLLSQAKDQPSEVLEVVSLPLKVISAVFEGPAKILSLKVDYTNKQADLANAQKSLVDATKALDDARKPQTTDDTSTGSTDTTP